MRTLNGSPVGCRKWWIEGGSLSLGFQIVGRERHERQKKEGSLLREEEDSDTYVANLPLINTVFDKLIIVSIGVVREIDCSLKRYLLL